MANTEGLSDEALGSLLLSTNEATNNSSRRSNRARETLEKRLDMPIGERPAATVVRKSRNLNKRATPILIPRASMYEASISPEDEEDEEVRSTQDTEPNEFSENAVPVLGSVMERPRRVAVSDSTGEGKKLSRFAQRRHLSAAPAGGFPSLDQPLGTFVTKAITKSIPSTNSNLQKESQRVTTRGVLSVDEIKQESSKDAQSMLEGMSMVEIRERQQELQSSLSPDLRAFLASRKQKTMTKAADSETLNEHPAQLTASSINESLCVDEQEKERISQVLSSIRTHEELDRVYEAEMGDLAFEGNSMGQKDEFQLACDLLRSSVPRQVLWATKVIYEKLHEQKLLLDMCSSMSSHGVKWQYPSLLPVSIRCVLDSPFIARPSGQILCTLVLQSLYALMQLRAHPDHFIDVTGTQQTCSTIYQMHFMNDAVPTPRLSSCYTSVLAQQVSAGEGSPAPAVAYATASSSTSAQSDAESFNRDPMWTMLSKMRIIPRIAHLLEPNKLPYGLPNEALVAVCGILAMLAQRSPGAATAIVQHKTLLKCVLRSTLNCYLDGSDSDLGLAAVTLLCTLARQSRIVAECLDVNNILLCVLARDATDDTALQIQRWTLILWRTLLRYGMGLSTLQSMLSLAAPSTTLGYSRWSIAPEYFSAFACVCDIVRTYNRDRQLKNITVTEETAAILSQAGVWLSSFFRHAVRHFSSPPNVDDCSLSVEEIRTRASCGDFVQAYQLMYEECGASQEGEAKVEDISQSDELLLLQAVSSAMDNDDFRDALKVSLSSTFFAGSGTVAVDEASACAYVRSVCLLVRSITSSSTSDSNTEESACDLLRLKLARVVHEVLNEIASDKGRGRLQVVGDTHDYRRARIGWQNQALSSLLSVMEGSVDTCVRRTCAIMLVGRLEYGEEALAAILFSHDDFFLSKRDVTMTSPTTSPLSTCIVRELCRSAVQLDHSFKLIGGSGIDSVGVGPFGLQTLLSEAEGTSGTADSLLPMGPLWLWQLLCGSVSSEAHGSVEAVQVLCTALSLILELESMDDKSYNVASSLPAGAKLYYVMNICLYPDAIVGDDKLQEFAGTLTDIYAKDGNIGSEFIKTCEVHSSTKQSRSYRSDNLSDTAENDLKKLLDPTSQGSMRCVEDFVADLCEAFSERGAQHLFYAKCIRILLLPSFPTKIRCNALQRLSGLLHLLTLQGDDIRELLSLYMPFGHPSVDGSAHDSPELLDTLAMITKKHNSRDDLGLLSLLATGLLARSLAVSIENEDSRLFGRKKRLEQLDRQRLREVLKAAAYFQASSRKADDLVEACLHSSSDSDIADNSLPVEVTADGNLNWDIIVTWLRGLKERHVD